MFPARTCVFTESKPNTQDDDEALGTVLDTVCKKEGSHFPSMSGFYNSMEN